MKALLLAVLCCALGSGLALYVARSRFEAGQARHVVVKGTVRNYLLIEPRTRGPGPLPLVLLLHGHDATASSVLGSGFRPSPLSAWVAVGEREGLLVAALEGQRGQDGYTGWHDCRADNTRNPAVDDVAYASAVVAQLVQAGRVDSRRVYVMGMSNGAMMAFRLALEMHPAPAAIAAVSGSMARRSACTGPPRVMSVLMVDGTDDPIVPFAGGVTSHGIKGSGSGVVGVDATLRFWLAADHLDGLSPQVAIWPHLIQGDPTRAVRRIYGASAGPQVEVVTVQGGGHVEPSVRYHYGWRDRRMFGQQNEDFESASEAWEFFRDKVAR